VYHELGNETPKLASPDCVGRFNQRLAVFRDSPLRALLRFRLFRKGAEAAVDFSQSSSKSPLLFLQRFLQLGPLLGRQRTEIED
jgi:hypothetical protein